MTNQHLEILKSEFIIHRFDVYETIPDQVYKSKFFWIGKTDEELSIVCESNILPKNDSSIGNWSIIKVVGKLDFSIVGILSAISGALKNIGCELIQSSYNLRKR